MRDYDLLVRTIYGEANGESPEGQQAVANVVLNRLRSGRYGKSMDDVLFAPKQFEPWNTRRDELMGLSPDSSAYRRAAETADGVLSGDMPDPTGGATHFANVRTVQDRGNASGMAWINDMMRNGSARRIGNHTFGSPDSAPGASTSDSRPTGRRQNGSGEGGMSLSASSSEAARTNNPTPRGGGGSDPRRAAVRAMIYELLADVMPPDGQSHAVAHGGPGQTAGLDLLTQLTANPTMAGSADDRSGPAPLIEDERSDGAVA